MRTLAFALIAVGCGGNTLSVEAGTDATTDDDEATLDDARAAGFDSGFDSPGMPWPSYGDAAICFPRDAAVPTDCPKVPCPKGSVCSQETGGVAGGGGSYCVPIPPACASTPTCQCMGWCACVERVNDYFTCDNFDGGIFGCDNGIR